MDGILSGSVAALRDDNVGTVESVEIVYGEHGRVK